MEAANADDVQYAIGKVSEEDIKKITIVIKVNVREKREDIATVFFALSSELADNATKKYTAFAKLEKPQAFDLNGERGYFAYPCKVHGKSYCVGQHVIKWTTKKTWARWENKVLDDLMGHPKKAVQDYGQPPMDLGGVY